MAENYSFYSLNGKIDNDTLINKIVKLKDLGYDNFVMHARAGLEIKYMGDEWFGMMRKVVMAAKLHGFKITLYDEDGWPSGFAGGQIVKYDKNLCAKVLANSHIFSEEVNKNLVASYKKIKNGYELCDNINECDYFLYYVQDEKYVDLLSSVTVDKFIEFIYEKYYNELGEFFGKEITGIFTDEPAIMSKFPDYEFAYSADLPKYFFEYNGYSLKDNLWKLFNKKYRKFIYDYHTTLAKAFFKNFTIKISSWCEKHNLKWTGHLSCEDSVQYSFRANGSCMYNYKYFQLPAIDFLGKRIPSPILMKQLSSVKNQYGKQEVLSECFGGAGYGCSLGDLKYIWNYHAIYGINTPCAHLSAYSIEGRRKRDFPQFFSQSMNGYENLSTLLNEIKELNEFISIGESASNALVLSPLMSCYSYYRHENELRKISNQYRILLENLDAIHVQYDLGDEYLIHEDGSVCGKNFCVKNKNYSVVIVSKMNTINKFTLELLRQYHSNGGKLVFIENLPTLVDMTFTRGLQRLCPNHEDIVLNRKSNLENLFTYYYKDTRIVRALEKNSEKSVSDILINVREYNQNLYVLAFNKSKTNAIECQMVFYDKGSIYEQIDGHLIGKKTMLDNAGVFANLNFEAGESRMFVLKRGELAQLQTKPIELAQLQTTPIQMLTELNCVGLARLDDNILLLDKVMYSFDNINYSIGMSCIIATEQIYSAVNCAKKEKEVYIKYLFNSLDSFKNLKLFIESKKAKWVKFNDEEITKSEEIWLDESIIGYNLSNILKGKNEIVALFLICPQNLTYNENEAETDKNRFFFAKEIENAYIKGNFSVKTNLIPTRRFCESDGEFSLQKWEGIDSNSINSQMPFYSGRINFSYRFNDDNNQKHILKVTDFNAHSLNIYINNKKAGTIINKNQELDVSIFVNNGENNIDIELFTKERNLFGPFHHIWGETSIISPLTFEGKSAIGEYIDCKDTLKVPTTEKYIFEKIFPPSVFIKTLK